MCGSHLSRVSLAAGNSLLSERQRSIVRQLDSIHKDMNRIYDTGAGHTHTQTRTHTRRVHCITHAHTHAQSRRPHTHTHTHTQTLTHTSNNVRRPPLSVSRSTTRSPPRRVHTVKISRCDRPKLRNPHFILTEAEEHHVRVTRHAAMLDFRSDPGTLGRQVQGFRVDGVRTEQQG